MIYLKDLYNMPILTYKDLINFIEEILKFKRYKILVFRQNNQLSILLPIKSHFIRDKIKEHLSDVICITTKVFVLELSWYDGWFNKLKFTNRKRIKNESK